MKVETQTFEEMANETYQRHKNGETIRDPHISIYFLQQFHTIGDLKAGRPKVSIIHCPSDDESLFLRTPPKGEN